MRVYIRNAIPVAAVVVLIACLPFTTASAQTNSSATYDFAYSGRLTDSNGRPLAGPVALKIDFYRDSLGQSLIFETTDGLQSVPLTNGVFQFNLQLLASDYAKIFSDVTQPVWIQITDLTNTPNAPYAPQQLAMVPYAARVPVDGNTVSFNNTGQLTVGPTGAPGSNQFLTKDNSGNLVWGTPQSNSAVALQGQTVSTTVPAAGQVLAFNGTQWVPEAVSAIGGAVTQVTTTPPLGVTSGSTTPALIITQVSGVSDGYLSSSDWIAFKAKLPAAGGTMSGALNMGAEPLTNLAAPNFASDAATKSYVDTNTVNANGSVPLTGPWNVGAQDLTNTGNLAMAAAKTMKLSGNTLDPTGLSGTNDKGKMWFNTTTNQLKYWDGATAQVVGAAGSGLTNLNGLTANTQTFAIGTTGSAPAFSSSGSVHTLSIPMASGTSVSAGLLSSTDYTAFSGKISSLTAGSGLSGGVITSGGTISLPTVGSVGTYTKVTTDVYGRVTGATTLTAGDIPPLSASVLASGTLNLAMIPSLPASVITSGTLSLATVPSLPASAITSGTLELSTVPSLPAGAITSGTLSLTTVPSLPASSITSGTLYLSTVPSLPASAITSGTLSVAQIPSIAGNYVATTGSTMTGSLNMGTNTLYTATQVIGTNDGSGTPLGGTLRSANSSGSNVPGANLIISAGGGTGTGASGAINFQTAAAGAAGAGADTFATIMTISPNGYVGIGSTAPGDPLVVSSSNNLGANSLFATTHVVGSSDATITPAAGILRAASGSGSNIPGANLVVTAGNGTGTGASGAINFQTAPAAANSSSANLLATVMTIQPSGNVGIGTAAPANPLDVAGQIRSINPGTSPSGSQIILGSPGNYLGVELLEGNGSAGTLQRWDLKSVGGLFEIYDNNSNATRLTVVNATGNVGIGTTAPAAGLEVDTGSNTTGQLILGLAGGANAGKLFFRRGTDGTAAASLGYASATENNNLQLTTTSGNGYFTFVTNNSSTIAERVRIDSYGNIGIGSTSPVAGVDLGTSKLGSEAINVYSNTAGSRIGWGTNTSESQFYLPSSNHISFNSGGDLQTSGTNEIMRIVGSGNIGIGTTTPGTMLEVNGTIHSKAGGIEFPDGTILTSANAAGTLTPNGVSSTNLALAADTGTTGNSSYNISFATDGTQRMVIANGGNVGVGNSSPASTFSVNGGVAIGSYATTNNAGSGNLIVSGNVGIGTSTVSGAALSVMSGNVRDRHDCP